MDVISLRGKSWSMPVGMVFKSYYCSHCGTKLVKSKTHRVVTKEDKDYYQYHEVGNYPRCDYDVYSYEFSCPKCNQNISYSEQCIVEMIQKSYGKRVLSNNEIKENYRLAKILENKRVLRRKIIIPIVFITIFFALMIIFDKNINYKKIIIYGIISISLIIYSVFMTIRSHNGKNILRRNQDYSYEQKRRIEKTHAYCKNNKELIIKANKCYCFHCKKIMESNEVVSFIDNKDTALCPYCGVDAIIPDSIDEKIDEELIEDMNKYWF